MGFSAAPIRAMLAPMSAGLAELVGRPVPDVARVTVEHHRVEEFRVLGLLELSLGLVCFICLLPVLLLVGTASSGDDMGGGDIRLPSIKSRLYNSYHELGVKLLDAWGRPLGEARFRPRSEAEGQAALASVLDAAARQGLVVVEMLSGSANEVAEVWYGGRPLMARPEALNEAEAVAFLGRSGLEVSRTPGELTVVETAPPLTLVQRVLFGMLAVVMLPFMPLLLFSESARRALRHMLQNIFGGPPEQRVVTARAESLESFRRRGDEQWDRELIDGRDLVGITFSPTLGYDRQVTRHPASLRFVGRRASRMIVWPGVETYGRALRDALLAATLRSRQERPELGLLGDGPHPTKCPYCRALYVMQPGTTCPSCGAYAGTTP